MDPIELQKQLQARVASGQGVAEFVRGVADEAHARARTGARVNAVVMGLMLSLFALGLLGAAVGAATGALGGANLAAAAGLTLGALAVGFGAGYALFLFGALRPPPSGIAATGVPVRLTVRDYRSARGSFTLENRAGSFSFQRVAIDVDVQPSEGAPFSATLYEYPPMQGLGALRAGAVLRGYADRANPAKVYVDWSAVA
ncbi:MAG: hypothetical protein R3A52_15365 [Polyangiales bacterium]